MGRIVLYIAQSLDGFIADENGSFHFLDDYMRPEEDYGYAAFLKTIGAVIMGSATYADILKMNHWYDDIENYIFSSKPITVPEGKQAFTMNGDAGQLVEKLRGYEKDSWLVGGSKLITQFMNAGFVDELILAIIPKTLGSGIPLFSNITRKYKPGLTCSKTYDDAVVQLHYTFNP